MNYEQKQKQKFIITYAELLALGRALNLAELFVEDQEEKDNDPEQLQEDQITLRDALRVWHGAFRQEKAI